LACAEKAPRRRAGHQLADVGEPIQHALPARLLLFLAAERARVKVERLVFEGRREGRREGPDRMPAQVVPQRLKRSVGEGDVERRKKPGLSMLTVADVNAELADIRAQTEGRHELVQGGDVVAVQRELHVALLLGCVRGSARRVSKRGCDRRPRAPLGSVPEVPSWLRRGRRTACAARPMLVVAQVVVALGKPQSAWLTYTR